jgi:hypothetical protein
MKPKRTRGMRELMTIQGLAGRTVPNSREQVVAEQARLEHERARLERELFMWQENERRTGERLAAVNERLAMLAAVCAKDDAESGRQPAAPRATHKADEPAEPASQWHEIVLEY